MIKEIMKRITEVFSDSVLFLTLSSIMLKNDQTRFLKYVWAFFNIMKEALTLFYFSF